MIVLERKVAYSLLGAGILAMLGILAASGFSGQAEIFRIQIPLHATLEAVGAVTAILVAIILFREKAAEPLVNFQLPALGLLGMGIFDLFHSSSLLGDSFVWLRSFSCLIGGIGYTLIWLPATFLNTRRQPWLPGAMAAILVFTGVAGAFSNLLPSALIDKHFSPLTEAVNLLAGVLFLLGSGRLLAVFHRHRRIEYYLLAWIGLLNAASGFELPLSRPWDNIWWLWHGLRFLGMGVAGFLLVYRQLETRRELALALADLQRANTTIQEKAAAELRAQEVEFTKVTNCLPGPVCRVDSAGRYLFANAAYARWFGKRPEEIIGRTQQEVLGVELYRRVQPQIQRAMAGEQVSHEVMVTAPSGEILHGQVSLLPDLDSHGRPRGHFVIVLDMTEQKRHQEEIGKLSLAMEQSPASLIITDPEGNIEYVNPKFEKVSGYSLDEVRGRNPRLLKSGHTSPEEYRNLWETILAGNEWRGEFHNRRKDGSLYWERATISPIRNAAGQITNFLAVQEDISEQKILGEQLQRAQRLESVGRLAGGVAHDLNNMLGVILGYTEMNLNILPDSSPLREDLEEIRKAALHSVNVTRQLLTFASRQAAAPVVIDFNRAVQDILAMLQHLLGENIHLDWWPAHNLWPVRIDPAQVEQILANLTINARDAITDTGTLVIATCNVHVEEDQLHGHPDSRPGDYCLLSVCDSGCGMDQATLSRIFEPFFTTKAAGKGTGLGLATVYGIVHQNQGFIEVASEPGLGTTFRIYLPKTEGETQPGKASSVQTAVRGGNETILLVEDEKAVLKLISNQLRRQGYTVLTADTPGKALALAASHPGPIHLLVTDLVMPEMNGRELSEKISGLRPATRIIYISGYTADILSQHEMLDDGVRFISKPFREQDLIDLVRETLGS